MIESFVLATVLFVAPCEQRVCVDTPTPIRSTVEFVIKKPVKRVGKFLKNRRCKRKARRCCE